ncbi:hypothetical protein M1L60_34975 [Actinoplanes sp. TRM 88003]|uniref:Uncharacterized protein n=1 Tax=Paractinoplanes aksuensis TaxID=2939490 RepID=A0ABT1E0J1_9ACTN|nr:hypothetical protein [Actinoplanes aksuensis]MCO8275796.1 hypothetical protein [Actinoplanes aksuensis]
MLTSTVTSGIAASARCPRGGEQCGRVCARGGGGQQEQVAGRLGQGGQGGAEAQAERAVRGQRHRQRGEASGLLRRQGSGQFGQRGGVALGQCHQRGRHLGGRVGGVAPDQGVARLVVEERQGADREVGRGGCGCHRGQNRDREFVHAAGEQPDLLPRLWVEFVGVVEQAQHRAVGGGLAQQRAQAQGQRQRGASADRDITAIARTAGPGLMAGHERGERFAPAKVGERGDQPLETGARQQRLVGESGGGQDRPPGCPPAVHMRGVVRFGARLRHAN